MAANFCIPKELTSKFVKALRANKISPEQLSRMSTEDRKAFLNNYFGEKLANKINTSFEDSFIKSPTESYITDTEVQKLTEMSKNILDAKEKITSDMPNGSPERLEFGTARALFQEYVSELKVVNKKPSFYLKNPKEAIYEAAGATKSILTSLDNSFFGRQGIKVLMTTPSIWIKNFAKSWKDIAKELGGKNAMIPIKADVLSRQNALNGLYQRMKLAIDIASEEAYPSSLPEKIPLLGRLYKASESAFNGAALRMRADLADRVLKQAEDSGVDLNDTTQLESLGKLVNSMTGRGSIGKAEAVSREINALFFSIKFLKSNFDTLTSHLTDETMSPYAKKEAAKNLAKIVAGTASVLYLSSQLIPGSVEWDPRSPDFGKIRIGLS